MPIQSLLGFPVGRGGKRKGAGCKPSGLKAGVRHESRAKVTRHTPVFVTTKVVAGLPSLRSAEEEKVVLKAFCDVNRLGAIRVVQYSIQSNHLHLVVETRSAAQLSRGMSQLLIRIARRLNKLWGRKGKLWKERFHSRVVAGPKQMRNVLLYCLNNAHKHGAWSDHSLPDPFSSSRWFEGWKNYVPEARDESCPVVAARSWLAGEGWRVESQQPLAS